VPKLANKKIYLNNYFREFVRLFGMKALAFDPFNLINGPYVSISITIH